MTNENSPVLNADEAARYLGLAKQTMAKRRLSGDSPPYAKLGRRVVYRRADLEAWLDANMRRSTSDTGTDAS